LLKGWKGGGGGNGVPDDAVDIEENTHERGKGKKIYQSILDD